MVVCFGRKDTYFVDNAEEKSKKREEKKGCDLDC